MERFTNPILTKFQTVSLSIPLSLLSIIIFFLSPQPVSAARPSDFGLEDGDVISANDDPDVYIVNVHGYKRLFVNPEIFNIYGHLGWDKIKKVSPQVRDAFITSGLFRNCEMDDPKVYGLEIMNEDIANLRWVNTSGLRASADDPNFFKKVFCINNNEYWLYTKNGEYQSVLQSPDYSRDPSTTNMGFRLESVVPNTIVAGYGTTIIIHGSGFKLGANFDFGAGSASPLCSVISDSESSCTVVSMPISTYNLSAQDYKGQVLNLNNALTIVPPTNGLLHGELFNKVAPSTVKISVDEYSHGSGIIISNDGYILTNAHVVEDNSEVDVFLTKEGHPQLDTPYKGKVLGKDKDNDLAVLKIEASNLVPIEFGSSNSKNLPVGSTIYAFGFPVINSMSSYVTQLNGKLTGLEGGTDGRRLRISAGIQPGNSGGPLVNDIGQLVGINTECNVYSSTGWCAPDLGFAIAIDYANPLIPSLRAGR
jgi:S1-C subfamily serine protease